MILGYNSLVPNKIIIAARRIIAFIVIHYICIYIILLIITEAATMSNRNIIESYYLYEVVNKQLSQAKQSKKTNIVFWSHIMHGTVRIAYNSFFFLILV